MATRWLKKIMEYDSNAYIAMVTSVVNAQIISRILSVGAIDAIKKPINEAKLQKIFDQLD